MSDFVFTPSDYPNRPGCYQFLDQDRNVLYVGKSKNLRKRLSSYFRKNVRSRRLKRLTSLIDTIEVILVNTETESLLLENTLIDHYRPPYNRMFWRADIGFPFIVQTDEPYPRFLPYIKSRPNTPLGDTPVRRYYGPYLNSDFRNEVLDLVNDYFKLRTCNPMPKEICLRYHIHRCSGPCEGHISLEDYWEKVQQADQFLSRNRHMGIIEQLKKRMKSLSEQLAFEQAERLHRKIVILETALEKQIVDRYLLYDQAMIYFDGDSCLVAEFTRGCLLKMDIDHTDVIENHDPIAEFLLRRFPENCPEEVISNQPLPFSEVARQLETIHGHPVTFRPPQSEVELDLLRLCKMNYEYRLAHQRRSASLLGSTQDL